MSNLILEELGSRGASAALGLLIGSSVAWTLARWRRRRERRRVREGDARDSVVIHHHLVERSGEPGDNVLRIRTVGQAELTRVVPNGHLATVLRHRAQAVTTRDTLISMAGIEGSYLLETLTDFVCDRVSNGPFAHDLYIMAPCCEPKELAQHQPISILLIAVADLAVFQDWKTCQEVQVEHGSDGARILTLMALARRFQSEQDHLARLRREGKRTQFVETMYVLDLSLDKRTAPLETKPVPWGRYEAALKGLGVE